MIDQDAYEDEEDHFSFVVTVRKREGYPLSHAPNADLGHIRRAIIMTAEARGIDIKVSGRRNR